MLFYIALTILAWMPPVSPQHARDEGQIAAAITSIRPDIGSALLLASLAYYEGSYRVHARGKLGEIGPWQLRPPPAGRAVPPDLPGQAREALYRWNTLGPCGYTGEGNGGPANGTRGCPMAQTRLGRATAWLVGHPYGG